MELIVQIFVVYLVLIVEYPLAGHCLLGLESQEVSQVSGSIVTGHRGNLPTQLGQAVVLRLLGSASRDTGWWMVWATLLGFYTGVIIHQRGWVVDTLVTFYTYWGSISTVEH